MAMLLLLQVLSLGHENEKQQVINNVSCFDLGLPLARGIQTTVAGF